MLRTLSLASLSLALLAPAGAAQMTWIVDANNGPGAHFTTLPPAIAASSSGDVILLRYGGGYDASGAVVTHGLSIIGSGGSTAILDLDVQVPAGEHVVLRNLVVYTGVSGSYMRFQNCDGSVHLQDVDFIGNGYTNNQLALIDCRLVTFTDCLIQRYSFDSMPVHDCDLVVMRGCQLNNGAGQLGADLVDSRLVSVDSAYYGLPSSPWHPTGRVAMSLSNSVVEFAGDSCVHGQQGNMIQDLGGSQVLVGPTANVALTGVPGVAATIHALGAFLDSASVVDVEVYGATGGIAVLSFGPPLAAALPLWGDSYWLDAPSVTVFDFVWLNGVGAGQWQANLPSTLPPGLSLWLQAAVIDAGGTFALTTPAVITTP